jgi:hypothetical protein
MLLVGNSGCICETANSPYGLILIFQRGDRLTLRSAYEHKYSDNVASVPEELQGFFGASSTDDDNRALSAILIPRRLT